MTGSRWLQWTCVLLLTGLMLGWLPAKGDDQVSAEPTAPIKIMPLGDSITSGTDAYISYRYKLFKSLQTAGYNFHFVGSVNGQWGIPGVDLTPPSCCRDFDWFEEGHSGWAIYHILNGAAGSWPGKLSTWAAAAVPDIVLIHLGTNNFVYTPPDYPAPDVNAAISQMGQVIDTLRAANPKIKILLAQIIPCNYSSATISLIPQFNALLPGLAASKFRPFSPIVVVDQYTGFDVVADTHDGIHPDDSGETKMAAKWKEGLDRIVKINNYVFIPLVTK